MKKILISVFVLVASFFCYGQGTLLTTSEGATHDTLGVATANTSNYLNSGYETIYVEFSATLTGVYTTYVVNYACQDVTQFRLVSASDSTVTVQAKIRNATVWTILGIIDYDNAYNQTFAITAAQMCKLRGYK